MMRIFVDTSAFYALLDRDDRNHQKAKRKYGEFVIPELHRAGTAALLSTGKRGLSLVDCVSFGMMRDLGIRIAFTFDGDFKKQGFDILP